MNQQTLLSKKTHDLMRKLQLIFAALAGSIAILASAIDLGKIGIIVTAVISAAGYFVGQLAEDDSGKYFANATITTDVNNEED